MGSWSSEMVHTVTVKTISARDDYGKPSTLGAATTIACRFEAGARRIVTAQGEVVDDVDLIITETAVDSSDQVRGGWDDVLVWPPGANTANDDEGREPISAMKTDDLAGADTLYEVEL